MTPYNDPLEYDSFEYDLLKYESLKYDLFEYDRSEYDFFKYDLNTSSWNMRNKITELTKNDDETWKMKIEH